MRQMTIADILSATASEQQLNAANPEPETSSISPAANAKDTSAISMLFFNWLNTNLFLLAPNTFSMLMSLTLNGIDAIEKLI